MYEAYAKLMNASDEVMAWLRTTLRAYLKEHPENQKEIEHMIDYAASSDGPEKMRKMSYEQLRSLADKWTKSQQKKGAHIKETESDTETIFRFDDGSRIALLKGKAAYEREGFLMGHCFHGDTKIITSRGTISIRDAVGPAKLLTRSPQGPGSSSFKTALVKGYGKQRIWLVSLRKGAKRFKVRTTSKHRWFYKENTRNKNIVRVKTCHTDELKPGNVIPTVVARRPLFVNESKKGVTPSFVGVLHGATFGDGTASDGRYAKLELIGRKSLLLKYVPKLARVTHNKKRKSSTIHDLPSGYKRLPDVGENAAYLCGFLAGLIATDGHVEKHGNVFISSARREVIQGIETICQRLGLPPCSIGKEMRYGYGARKTALFSIRFSVGTIPKELLLLPHHSSRYRSPTAAAEWVVDSVYDTKTNAEVYCAEVPSTKAFALENNILTGNCVASFYGKKDTKIYSYRDKNNNPHITFDLSENGDGISQLKGKGNGSVHPNYIEPILKFLEHLKIDVRESEMKNLGYHHVEDDKTKSLITSFFPKAKFKIIGGKEYVFAG